MKAVLALEDGTIFTGKAFGRIGTVMGEIVFNTGMTGYQEVLTDPSYRGQIVTMTYPLIGNYGANSEDSESIKPQARGLIVREKCDEPSNWRSEETLNSYLERYGIIGIEGIDTRALTRVLRTKGTMNGVISTERDFSAEKWLDEVRKYKIVNPVDEVTTKEVIHYEGKGPRIALLDYGVRESIVRLLRNLKCDVYVLPASTPSKEILDLNPDGIVLSNGPGNPKDCSFQINVIKELTGKIPILGIGLGHQLVALSYGANTEKLKYGHRGANHPVKDVKKNLTYITSQNHGYIVLAESLDPKRAQVSHINMNDNTVEGVRYLDSPTITVQFNPDTQAASMSTSYIYDEFINLINN